MLYTQLSQNVKILTTTLLLVLLVGCGGARTTTTSSDSSTDVSQTDGTGTGTGTDTDIGTVTIGWLPPTENTNGSTLENLAGYKIYYGTTEGVYSEVITINNVGTTAYVIDNLLNGCTYYFVLTAFNSRGMESSYSVVVTKAIPAA